MHALALDCETTGLLSNHTISLSLQPEVIEFAATKIDLETGEVLEEYETLVRPQRGIPAEVIGITRIDNEMVVNAPFFRAVADRIFGLIQSVPIVICHNASYDWEILRLEQERLGAIVHWPRFICTVESTIHYKGFRLGLNALHEHLFGEPFKEAHRARADVNALTRCAVELYKRGDL